MRIYALTASCRSACLHRRDIPPLPRLQGNKTTHPKMSRFAFKLNYFTPSRVLRGIIGPSSASEKLIAAGGFHAQNRSHRWPGVELAPRIHG